MLKIINSLSVPVLFLALIAGAAIAVVILFGSGGSSSVVDSGDGESASYNSEADNPTDIPELDLGALWDIFIPPQNISELVNRAQAIAVVTIESASDSIMERPYHYQPDPDIIERGLPEPEIHVVYYRLRLDNILLDDGNISQYPLLRLAAPHTSQSPQPKERFLLSLWANPDNKSYGVLNDWDIIALDNQNLLNDDGSPVNYPGITDEASLITAIKAAVPGRTYLPIEQWPKRELPIANENAPAETPQPSGGPGPDDTGPAGNANN